MINSQLTPPQHTDIPRETRTLEIHLFWRPLMPDIFLLLRCHVRRYSTLGLLPAGRPPFGVLGTSSWKELKRWGGEEAKWAPLSAPWWELLAKQGAALVTQERFKHRAKTVVRYLREDKPHGSAGGLYNFRDWLMENDPTNIFVMNCDVCCSFPLSDMLVAHSKFNGIGTLLVKKVSAESASEFGELVADPETGELLHYAEKPETFVSEWINCGVYIFTPQIFLAIQDVASQRKDHATMRRVSSFEALQMTTNYGGRSVQTDFVRLDQDILTPLAGKKKLYTFETTDFWEQIKTPGMSLRCSALYLAQYRQTAPEFLAKGDGVRSATYIGDVYVHPSAKVHPTAKVISPCTRMNVATDVRVLVAN
ncbi:hypothetical protein L7F22_060707 [Adiantum nelumboides]|nr:hypothetical protein [Adiantum nelumboides]